MAQHVTNFLTALKWQDWVALAGFLFGLISLIAYLDQRRSAKRTAKISEWAERNLDKSVSEEQIKQLLGQKAAMEEQITRNVPALARTAVLQEQAELHAKAIADHFASWKSLTEELGSRSPVPGLDPGLQQVILDRIVPRFQRQEQQERLRTRVTVLSVGLAISSAILPFPLSSALPILLGIPLLSAAVRLLALNIEDEERAFKAIRTWVHLAYFAVALASAGFAWVMFTSEGVTRTGFVLGQLTASVAAILIVAYPWARKVLNRVLAKAIGAKRPA